MDTITKTVLVYCIKYLLNNKNQNINQNVKSINA